MPASLMHRLVYLCDWLPPDFGAVGQYSLLFARERAASSQDVVLAGLSSTMDSIEEESHGSGHLRIVRLHASTYDRANFRTRAMWTARTNATLLWRLRRELRRADEILFTGSPPFLIQFLVPLNLFLRKRLTYRITDFHPECLIAELSQRGSVPRSLRWFECLTNALRRRVARFEVLGEDQRRRLHQIGISDEKIVLRRDPSPIEFPAAVEPLAPPPSSREECFFSIQGTSASPTTTAPSSRGIDITIARGAVGSVCG
ncbi:MAG: glycosyltransferase family 4 protein, partial [Aquincola sp.]|nr:glycosyltransferase family 4 protein [Aquincola sp.]